MPHKADELEEAEELVAWFFAEPEDTEWSVYEDRYDLDNDVTTPYSNGWCTEIIYGGEEEWNRTFGGSDYEVAYSVQQTSDGGYVLAGYTYSYGAGETDFWLVKVKGEEPTGQPTISIYTDKTSYIAGDKMHLGLDVKNPLDSAQRVSLYIYLELPTGGTFTLIDTTVTLPAELDYSNPDFTVFTLPNIPTGKYTWHAILDDPATRAIIYEDTAVWEFVLRGASTEDITEILELITGDIDFAE